MSEQYVLRVDFMDGYDLSNDGSKIPVKHFARKAFIADGGQRAQGLLVRGASVAEVAALDPSVLLSAEYSRLVFVGEVSAPMPDDVERRFINGSIDQLTYWAQWAINEGILND